MFPFRGEAMVEKRSFPQHLIREFFEHPEASANYEPRISLDQDEWP